MLWRVFQQSIEFVLNCCCSGTMFQIRCNRPGTDILLDYRKEKKMVY